MIDNERTLPPEVNPGRRTPTFNHETVPAGLLRSHHTTVWARLVVQSGSVEFTEESSKWKTTATRSNPVVIVPNRHHHIEPSVDAQFHVQFYDSADPDSPGTASSEPKGQ